MNNTDSDRAVDDQQWFTAIELQRLIRTRVLSPVEVVQAALERLERLEPQLNAFVTTTPELALRAAREAEESIARGEPLRPLSGLPLSLKDNIPVASVPLTFGSRTARDTVATTNAPVVERLLEAGACIVGKTTMTEFGAKAASNSPLTGLTRNPFDLAMSAGGSSGGSAASVAAGVTPFSVGTDGAGSLRVPTAFCGVVGFKAQYGRVPVYPTPTAPNLLHIGPISRTVRDAALLLQVMAGHDARDPNSIVERPADYVDACDRPIAGWTVAWSPTLGYANPDKEVLEIVRSAVTVFERLGCRIEEVDHITENPYSIVKAEFLPGAAVRLKKSLQHDRQRLDPDVVELLEDASRISATDYFEALFARYQLRQRICDLFKSFRLLLTPTLPVAAFAVDQSRPPDRPDESVVSWPSYPMLFNLVGVPAASVPCGFTRLGLPVGLQIAAAPYAEVDIFAAAAAFESAHPWATRRPALS